SLLVLAGIGFACFQFLGKDGAGREEATSPPGKDNKVAPIKDSSGSSAPVDPGKAATHFHLAIAHARTKEYGKAVAEFDTALHIRPTHAATYYNRGWTYHLMGKPRKAIADLSEAIRLRPRNPLFCTSRGILYRQQKQLAKAVADFDQVIRLRPRGALGYDNRGWTYHL